MRSIILTDKQHASLKVFIDHALIKDQYYMNEKLYREIMDVKKCLTCRHWDKQLKHCKNEWGTVDTPEDGWREDEMGESYWLSCYEKE